MQVLAAEGVAFRLNASVLGVRDPGDGKEVRIKTKEGETIFHLKGRACGLPDAP